MDEVVNHAKAFGLPIKEFTEVESLTFEGRHFIIKTSAGLFESMGVIVQQAQSQ